MSPVSYSGGGGTTIVQGGSGPNPTDDFSIKLRIAETNAAATDATGFAFTFPETLATQTDAASFGFTFPDTNAAPTEVFDKLTIRHSDTNALPADAATFVLRPTYGDTNVAATDAVSNLRIAVPGDVNDALTDARSGNLTWTQGATTASQTGSWTNPTNAQGTTNATNATVTDAATDTNAGTLSLTAYPDAPADLQTWTVTGARLLSYHAATNWIGITNNLVVSYDIGAGFVTMWTITTNENFASTPRAFTLPVLTWAQVNAMQVRFVYTADLLTNTATINVDAVHLEVTASKSPL